ncbi:MAG: hypothetical protein Q9228_004943 [Teloschistes exilis]
MHLLRYLVPSAIAYLATAAPAPVNHVLHEKRESAPRAWAKRDRVNPTIVLPVRIGLTQNNLENGPSLLDEVSNPASSKYGQHYTAEEIHDLFAPSQDSVDSVRQWLEAAGIAPHRVSLSTNKQWLQFDAETLEVENLLQAEYHHYEHAQTGRTNIGCDQYDFTGSRLICAADNENSYHVPAHVQKHVDYVTPGLKLLTPSRPKSKAAIGAIGKRTFGATNPNMPPLPPLLKALPDTLVNILKLPFDKVCNVAVLPFCIQTFYNITTPTKAAPGNELGIFEDLNDKYSQTDLNLFFLSLAPQIPQGTHPTLKAIDGATAPVPVTQAGPESDLDFQISYPIIYPQNSILFQTDDDPTEANYIYAGFLNNFLDALDGSYCTYSAFGETGNSPLDPPYPDPKAGGYKGNLQCGVYKPTNVISVSYGGQEIDLPPSYQQRQCNEFMKLGMQGVSVFISSGDSGVAGPSFNGSNGCLGPKQNIFSPDFPANCPYVTAVGATFLPPGASAQKDEERAVTRFPSGGGFSNIYPIPAYQQQAVANYFATSNPPYPFYTANNGTGIGANGGIYNRAGRGYPDVSAVGDNVVIFNMGAPTLIGGTSASSPVFAAVINRVNEERLAAGKKPVGFVNPILYANPGVLHDITVGSNPGCGTNGFSVAKGWDPVTGYFLQDEPSTNVSTFNFLTTNFGLINRTYDTDSTYDPAGKKTQWQRFANQVFRLNRNSGRNIQYKLLYLGRHGEGYHNAAESYYGTPAWNCYWSELDGNGTVTWADARLTTKGIAQALTVNNFWSSEIKNQKIPTPQSYYTSPLTRCLSTANLTFSGLNLPSRHPFIPTVKEFFREGISGHTCDRRGSKSYIQSAFPTYKIEAGFAETDQLWEAYHGETQVDQDIRSKAVLDDVFSHDDETYLSVTSHSGEIASLLRVLGHQKFSLSTGAVIPVLVKAETLGGPTPTTATQPYTPICTCTSPPAIGATTSSCTLATATSASG